MHIIVGQRLLLVVLLLSMVGARLHGAPTPAPTPPSTQGSGPFAVLNATFEFAEMDRSNRLIDAVYPAAPQGRVFPLVSFAHGFAEGGNGVMEAYGPLLSELASWGFVVVATRACSAGCVDCAFTSVLDPPCFGHFYKQQLKAIEWAKFHASASPLPVDTQAGVSVAGHSMGGQATLLSSAADVYAGYNITSAVMFHPYTHTFPPAHVPHLIFTGTSDTTAPPSMAHSIFSAQGGSPTKGLINAVNRTHFEPEVDVTNLPRPNSSNYNPFLARYAAAWFKIHLGTSQGSSGSGSGSGSDSDGGDDFYAMIYGDGPSSLCYGGDGEMETCLVKRAS